MCRRKNCKFISIIEDDETGKKCYVHYDKNNKVIFEEGDLILKDWLEEAQRKQREKEMKTFELWGDIGTMGSLLRPRVTQDVAGNIIEY